MRATGGGTMTRFRQVTSPAGGLLRSLILDSDLFGNRRKSDRLLDSPCATVSGHPIDPKTDCVFKALLGAEDNRDLLIHFLNAILGADLPSPVTQVYILNPYKEREFVTACKQAQLGCFGDFRNAGYHPPSARM